MPPKLPRTPYFFTDTSFRLLMNKRINNVLVVCSTYDFFMLEEDGRIDEQIFHEYASLNLRHPPLFHHAGSISEMVVKLQEQQIDLVIMMLSSGHLEASSAASELKKTYPTLPLVLLAPYSRELSLKMDAEELRQFDYVFSWLGNADILLAIIKLFEDRMNAPHDANEIGVQVILLVEDSVRFYSSYLPLIYKLIFTQSQQFMTEGLNEHRQMLRLRGRPKILLATTYEDAMLYYTQYRNNLLGIISDIGFWRNGVKDMQAGIRFRKEILKENSNLPFILQSSQASNRQVAESMGTDFIDKNSKTLTTDLGKLIQERLAFGDFIFRDPFSHTELGRANDLQSLQQHMMSVPDNCLEYHFRKHDFSRWLRARALFQIAEMIKSVLVDDFSSIGEVKEFVHEIMASYRLTMVQGVIAQFNHATFDEYFLFSRIGNGSIGGKARGLAFIDSLVKRHRLLDRYHHVRLTIPRTVVLSTDIFRAFIESNNLLDFAIQEQEDANILERFISCPLPAHIQADLDAFLAAIDKPIAVRSSSLLEDSHHQPFAGIYSTYMIPNNPGETDQTRVLLRQAIKSVYASVYFRDSKDYLNSTSNIIGEEEMAIVLQEICGQQHGQFYHPTFSGVARSVNFYPIDPEKREEGVANVAYGLGKYIVEGGISIRFSPKHPGKIIQLSDPQQALRETQKAFYSLSLDASRFGHSTNEAVNLSVQPIKEAIHDPGFALVSSTFDLKDQVIRDGNLHEGKKIITFNNILKHKKFPLATIIDNLLVAAQQEMDNPVEIEFAVNISQEADQPHIFNLLQIRPIVENDAMVKINWAEVSAKNILLKSDQILGNGIVKGINDVVYVKTEPFDASNNHLIPDQISVINKQMQLEGRQYILIGPGRWGSTDPWLGIPVKWPHISGARLIVECGLENYRVDPSQGTHFFHNLTSFQVGYMTINPSLSEGYLDTAALEQAVLLSETKLVKHVRFSSPLEIMLDSKNHVGAVLRSLPGPPDNYRVSATGL